MRRFQTLPAALTPPWATPCKSKTSGLSQIIHPPDKAAYARRLVEQMERTVYNQK